MCESSEVFVAGEPVACTAAATDYLLYAPTTGGARQGHPRMVSIVACNRSAVAIRVQIFDGSGGAAADLIHEFNLPASSDVYQHDGTHFDKVQGTGLIHARISAAQSIVLFAKFTEE